MGREKVRVVLDGKGELMLLKNKWTGETNIVKVDEDYFNICKDDGEFVCPVTLKELNEGWEEYYEEPKEWWYIDIAGEMKQGEGNVPKHLIEGMKQIGNYFSSREEAELAVRKLKAWKRLKDKGFRFELWDYDGGNYQERIRTGKILFRVKDCGETDELLDAVFGGEE